LALRVVPVLLLLTDVGHRRSRNLAAIAARRGHAVVQADNLALPYRTGAFVRSVHTRAVERSLVTIAPRTWRAAQDHVLSIAVLHHFATEARRRDALRELVRVLRPGGTALVFVWALEQEVCARGVAARWRQPAQSVTDGCATH
jgi:SAM-dependent methyltransferase